MVTVREANRRPVNRSHVEESVARLAKLAVKMEVKDPDETWHVVAGSHKYKQPWKLMASAHGMDVPVTFLPNGYLGETVTQAHQKLQTVYTAWLYIHNKQGV